jgi:hypothetical protein
MKITITSLLFALLIPAIAATQTYKAEPDYLNTLLSTHEKAFVLVNIQPRLRLLMLSKKCQAQRRCELQL